MRADGLLKGKSMTQCQLCEFGHLDKFPENKIGEMACDTCGRIHYFGWGYVPKPEVVDWAEVAKKASADQEPLIEAEELPPMVTEEAAKLEF